MKTTCGALRVLPWFMALLLGMVLAACGGGGGDSSSSTNPPPASATLLAVAVTPAVVSIPTSAVQAFRATATYSDGTTQDVTTSAIWTSGTTAVANVVQASGVTTSMASGSTTISAGFSGKTGSATLTVTSAVFLTLSITPAVTTVPINGVQPFVATATYSDGSTRDVTAFTVWTSNSSAIGTAGASTGMVTGVAGGTTLITGSFLGKTSSTTMTVSSARLVSLAVTPSTATVVTGGVQRFAATASFSDGTSLDVTAYSTWTTGAAATGTVVQTTGVATGVATGSTAITANYFGKTSAAVLTVSSASLVSIAVTPATAVVPLGLTQALVAKGTYSDGSVVDITTTATWSSNAPQVAAVLANSGVVTGVAGGSAVLTAALGTKSGTATVTVPVIALVTIAVTPASAIVSLGGSQAFVAQGTYTDGSTANISTSVAWASGTPSVATVIASTGVASGLSAGTSVVTATLNGKTGTANLTVTATVYNGPAPVGLGIAGSFVALAKTGISTTGATSIIGDIGVSPVAASFITGFGLIADSSNTFATSSLVTGKIYAANYAPPSPAYMTTAIGNLQTAFTDAAGRSNPDFTELYAGDISGKTLAPGLYKWGTGLLVGSAGVTLSGGADAVWIFQVAQDLTVGSGANVILIGGAQAKNVFWQVSGKATLGTTAVFKGILMSQTLISLSTGATVTGRLLAQTAVTLDAAHVSAP